MKIFCLISLVIISLSLQSQVGLEGRDFLTGVFTVVKGNDFKLDDNCLGVDFDENLAFMYESIKKKDLLYTMQWFGEIANGIQRDCSSSIMIEIFNDSKKLFPTNWFIIFQKYGQKIVNAISEEMFEKEINARTIGETFGKIINIMIYNKSLNADKPKFLQIL